MSNAIKLLAGLTMLTLLAGCVNTPKHNVLSIGPITKQVLFSKHPQFLESYEQFTVSNQEMSFIKQWPNTTRVEVFFGTWCHDSEREVPRLLKLLNYQPDIEVTLIALDYQKGDPQGLANNRAIKYTPTIILYKNNKEAGRIIERPKGHLISDISSMLVN
ncbi:thioredoxin family protein [Colwelliaceae bacterium 6441]